MKKLIAMALALVMVLGLGACTTEKEPVPSAPPSGAESNPPEGPQGGGGEGAPVEISLWTYPVGNWGDEATVNKLLSDFNAVYPNITVKVEYLAYGGDGDAKIDSAIEGGQAPDIVFEGPERLVANWGAKGVGRPVDR